MRPPKTLTREKEWHAGDVVVLKVRCVGAGPALPGTSRESGRTIIGGG